MARVMLAVVILTLALTAGARTRLVAVGIADYSGFPARMDNLRLSANDARAIAALYSKNTSVDYTLLLDGKATRDRILKAMDKVLGAAGDDDIVVFFFSGHGYPGGLCACDGKLSYAEVRAVMSRSRCPNKMMFIDACRSGGLRVDESLARRAAADAGEANVMLFLSCRNTENSIEHRLMKNGFFTTYLLKALRGNADADRDRTITARELFDFVHHGVEALSGGKQHPVMWGNFDEDMPVIKW